MIDTIAPSELERFRGAIIRRVGLQFDEGKSGFLAEVLRRRLKSTKLPLEVYLTQLDAAPSRDEVVVLAQELTIAETYFFRYIEQYRAFTEEALPDRLRRAHPGVPVSVVSAGCASGEEPYSLAIAVREAALERARDVAILGVDINPALLEKARGGRFSPWVMRETPPDVQRRWFKADGREFVLDTSVRNAVRFESCNLSEERPELWRPDTHDIVFCRNVLMYFEPSSAEALVIRFARSLRPGGYLFLGHAETLRGLSADFHLRHTHGTFYYQKKGHDELHLDYEVLATPAPASTTQSMALADSMDGASSWINAIAQASERIRSLVESPKPSASSPRAERRGTARPLREIALALELLREERFGEALQLVNAFPAETAEDGEVLLLRAVLLTHNGQLATAERACEQLLAVNELNAEAHYLLALCREAAGDHAGSAYHDQVAIYLDPTFAMARLHLGLLARRAHDRATAQRELQQAVALLQREDASRLLLFGGGFSRDALVGLCRAELQAGREQR